MSLTNLYNRLNGQTIISLNQAGLGEAGQTLFPLLPELSEATVIFTVSQGPTWDDATHSKFTITGTSQQPLLGLAAPAITFDAIADGHDIQFRIQVETGAGWTFGTSFPQLTGTEFNLFSFDNPRFILATLANPEEKLLQGLNFKGDLQLANTTLLPAIEEFITGATDSLPLTGTIQTQDHYQLITIKAQIISGDAAFSVADLLNFQFSAPDLALYAYIYRGGQPVALIKRIESNVTLNGESGHPVTLPLALQLPTLVTGWLMMLQPDQETSLADFLEFLTLLGSAGQFDLMGLFTGPLTAVKEILNALLLKSFSIEIIGSLNAAPQFRSFSFQVQQQENAPWRIIPNRLELANLQVYLRISKEPSSYNTAGFIQGELGITDSIAINALIPVPIGNGDWQFSSRHSVPLSDINVLSKFTDDTSITTLLPASLVQALSSLTLQELILIYNPSAGIKQLKFTVTMEEHWVIIENSFELASLQLHFELEKGTTGWGLSGNIYTQLLAGGITIDSQVRKSSAASDWYFNLHANNVPLPSLADLGRLTGGENALADTLPDSLLTGQLYLNDPRVEFNISQKKLEAFGFSLVTNEIDFTEIKILQVGLDVDIVFGVQRNINIYGRFTISDIDFYVEGTYVDTGGWQFFGQAAMGTAIPIGELISKFVTEFGIAEDVPTAIDGLTLSNLSISFNTQTKDFTFSLDTKFPIDQKELDAVIAIELTHNNGQYTRKFSGVVTVGDLEFDLILNQEQAADTIFLAAYENKAGKDESIKTLVELITDDPAILDVAEGISFNLKDALLVIDKGTATKILFGLDIGGGLDISKLPLVGAMFPTASTVRITFQPLLTNQDFSAEELNPIRALVPAGGYQLPQEAKERLGFNMQLLIGQEAIDLSLPIGVDVVKNQPPTTSTPPTTTASEPSETSSVTPAPPATTANIKWFVIQKQLGPINFGRVGLQFQDAQLYILLDASLSLAGLTISVDGLFVSSTLNPTHPQFGLHGLGLDYKNEPLEIGGAFLRQTVTDSSGNTYDTYDGTAIIRTEKFSLAALGSYAYIQGHPSLFIYAFVDWPLGGPAFFFVTGLAAGFGYNRRLIVPGINEVQTFPLVAEAMAGVPGATNDLSAEINKLHAVIPPAVGEYFLAVGIRFTSFKIIDSFVLLTVSFSQTFEVDVLGLSTLVIPTPVEGEAVEPLAEIQMALKAVFNPEKGYLKVRAALTSISFILSRDCHLTGGFAFYTWFTDNPEEQATAGDFVLTLGGYHPRFRPPAYYPKVAPLGFNWRVNSNLVVKGDVYFALVPSMVMAGGHLSATWTSGNLKAWFQMGADFIISWKPYFYDATMYVEMGVSYTYHFFGTHHITVDVGADLHIWGPQFSGKAHVHLWIVTFNVAFGARTNPAKPALTWDEFRQAFLPEPSKWESVTVNHGLVKQLGTKDDPLFIINPKEFMLETSSALPITSSTNDTLSDTNTNINVGSMKITNNVTTTHNITIKLDGADVTSDFTFLPIKKHVPGAIWGSKFKHSENEPEDERLIKNACTGFLITGKPIKASTETHDVATENLLNENEPFEPSISYEERPIPVGGTWLKSSGVKDQVKETLEQRTAKRTELLQALGFTETYQPNKELADEFIVTAV